MQLTYSIIYIKGLNFINIRYERDEVSFYRLNILVFEPQVRLLTVKMGRVRLISRSTNNTTLNEEYLEPYD